MLCGPCRRKKHFRDQEIAVISKVIKILGFCNETFLKANPHQRRIHPLCLGDNQNLPARALKENKFV